MPKGYSKYKLVQRCGAKKPKPPKVCFACGAKLFRGVTCPVCDDDLMELFALCVLDGTVKVKLDEALELGIPIRYVTCVA